MLAYTEADTSGVKEMGSDKLSSLIKLSGLDKGVLKDAFLSDGTSAREGYFGLQRVIRGAHI